MRAVPDSHIEASNVPTWLAGAVWKSGLMVEESGPLLFVES